MSNRCPLTGLPTEKVFFSGADSTTRHIMNDVLAGRMTLEEMDAELKSDRFVARGSDPQRFREAIKRAQADGVKKIEKPKDYF